MKIEKEQNTIKLIIAFETMEEQKLFQKMMYHNVTIPSILRNNGVIQGDEEEQLKQMMDKLFKVINNA